MSGSEQQITCGYCKRVPRAGHLRVTRVGPDGVETGSINICSFMCLINWAYLASAQRVRQGVEMGKGIVERVLTTIRGK
jgi:hypothetical protein